MSGRPSANTRRKRDDRGSSTSSPETGKPPAKLGKTSTEAETSYHEELSELPELPEIWKMLSKIQANTDKLLEESREMRQLYNELTQSMEFQGGQIEELQQENKTLKVEVATLKKDVAEEKREAGYVCEDLNKAIGQLDDLEQYTRKFNLEIHGIGEGAEENINEHIIKLGNVLNVKIANNDIDICHRLPKSKTSSQPRPIIVRFKSYRAKKELYAARKHLKGLKLEQTFSNTSIVYINENLTRWRRQVFSKVWKHKKEKHWHSVWTIDGKIFVRKSENDRPARIFSAQDLD